MRGDRPSICAWSALEILFTPHARGSTLSRNLRLIEYIVYPACAGIDLPQVRKVGPLVRLPRMRGDRPGPSPQMDRGREFTPHARGSTFLFHVSELSISVYPACAGIDLRRGSITACCGCLPRMRGDRPYTLPVLSLLSSFTPHARGST